MHTYINLHANHREDFANILPELYVPVADPELSANRRDRSNRHSVIDYEELCKFSICSTTHVYNMYTITYVYI